MTTQTHYYKSTVKTPFGALEFIVISDDASARGDVYEAVIAETKMPRGMVNVHEVTRTTRAAIRGAYPVKACRGGEVGQWAWVRKVKVS